MQALVTVGTDDGGWAPPKLVELTLTTKNRTGLGIANRDQVCWTAEARGVVTRAAMRVGTGEWKRVDLSGSTEVVAGQDVVLKAGVLVIDVDLDSVSLVEQRRLMDASRRLLSKRSTDHE